MIISFVAAQIHAVAQSPLVELLCPGACIAYLEGCKVDDTVNVWVLLEHLIETSLIGYIDLIQIWTLSADEFDAIDRLFGGVVKIVHYHNFVIGFQ